MADHCLYPHVNRYQCDIRVASTLEEGLLEGTKGIILLGEKAFYTWAGAEYEKYLLQEQRGYLLEIDRFPGVHVIATWTPQDCMDIEDFELRLNPLLKNDMFRQKIESIRRRIKVDNSKNKQENEKRRHGKTSRGNYSFWLYEDIQKLLKIALGKVTPDNVLTTEKFMVNVFPSATTIERVFTTTKNKEVVLDIETNWEYQVTVFSVEIDFVVYVVPLVRYNYSFAYPNTARIMAALAILIRDNIIICHNSMFDMFILAWQYGIPCGPRNYDTMLAHHRTFVEIEKSLGHCVSHLTHFEKFHKDEGVFNPHNTQQEMQLWNYNAKDVMCTRLVKMELDRYSGEDAGLTASIQQSNDMIQPYICIQLQGIRFNEEKRRAIMAENDKLMMHYLKAIEILVGYQVLPTSHKQCNSYFKDGMGYPVLRRSKTTQEPSWDENAQQELRLKYPENPMLDFCLAYRERAKETGSLKFEEWLITNEEIKV